MIAKALSIVIPALLVAAGAAGWHANRHLDTEQRVMGALLYSGIGVAAFFLVSIIGSLYYEIWSK